MLIKNYTKDGNMHIIDGVSDVSVLNNFNQDIGDSENILYQEELAELAKDDHPVCKAIQYIDRDERLTTLMIANVAYICNDQGKTIEKVWSN